MISSAFILAGASGDWVSGVITCNGALEWERLPAVSSAITVTRYMVEAVRPVNPATVSEDFGKYGRTDEKIPIALFWLGGVNIDKYNEHISKGTQLPPLHNSSFAPDFDPAFRTGVAAMSKTIIDLFGNKK